MNAQLRELVATCAVGMPLNVRQRELILELAALAAAGDAVVRLQAFKDFVHRRLDEMGVPVDPESPHKAAGCRIGGRLDYVEARLAAPSKEAGATERVVVDYNYNGDPVYANPPVDQRQEGALTYRNPAPHAAAPCGPSRHVTLGVGVASPLPEAAAAVGDLSPDDQRKGGVTSEWGHSVYRAEGQPDDLHEAAAQAASPPVAEARFFIEHGVVHDRKTGQHVGAGFEPDATERLLALLRTLENEAWAARMTAKAFRVAALAWPTGPQPAGGGVDDAMVERALSASTDHWNKSMKPCADCNGTGQVACGDSQDYCDCGGGFISDATEESAMRAALLAAIKGDSPHG